ncbi:hypothetical protein JRQ81_010386 [Phrynocephalus forsythii]|uniref:Uncharacterized protein n=1 Tax=Phrynocephalus forsythii TaxID=171643 RepID=A0A9Q0XAD4_9SAUR|nr:hypothetical protein JRQ81_010386 [Phrynocephalus forsythii]
MSSGVEGLAVWTKPISCRFAFPTSKYSESCCWPHSPGSLTKAAVHTFAQVPTTLLSRCSEDEGTAGSLGGVGSFGGSGNECHAPSPPSWMVAHFCYRCTALDYSRVNKDVELNKRPRMSPVGQGWGPERQLGCGDPGKRRGDACSPSSDITGRFREEAAAAAAARASAASPPARLPACLPARPVAPGVALLARPRRAVA